MEPFDFITNIDLWAAIFFILGFLLVVFEMFHPGFGAPGILGSVLLLLGVITTARNLWDVIIMILIILVLLALALTLALHSATKGRLSKTLILNESLKKEFGYEGTEDLNYFLLKEGKAFTVLRPSGTGDFDGVKLDVVTQGEFIEKGDKIKVIKVEGRRIVVEKI